MFFSSQNDRNASAIFLRSQLQFSRASCSHGCVYLTLPDAGKATVGVSALLSRRAFLPTFGRSSSRQASRFWSGSFCSQAIVTLATVRPILCGVAVRVRRDNLA